MPDGVVGRHAAHFPAGLAFAVIYYAIFKTIGYAGSTVCALFSLVHGIFSADALVNVAPRHVTRIGAPISVPRATPR